MNKHISFAKRAIEGHKGLLRYVKAPDWVKNELYDDCSKIKANLDAIEKESGQPAPKEKA